MSNVFWRCILEGAPEMQLKKAKNKNGQKKQRYVRHVNIFMVIPHNLRTTSRLAPRKYSKWIVFAFEGGVCVERGG